jgi:hypothetical protein
MVHQLESRLTVKEKANNMIREGLMEGVEMSNPDEQRATLQLGSVWAKPECISLAEVQPPRTGRSAQNHLKCR